MIQAQKLSKRYTKKIVLDSVDADFSPGLIHGLLGPNGAGKSTLLSLLGGIQKADSGRVVIFNKALEDWKAQDLAKRVSMLFQDSSQQARLRVEELCALGRFPHSGRKLNEEDQRIIEQALDYLELLPLRNRFIQELSGGERQRAHLAMVLAQDTDYILLDEPLNNLDPAHSVHILKLLRRFCDDLGKTILIVLHDLLAANQCDRLLAMKDGKVLYADESARILEPGVLKELYDLEFSLLPHKGRFWALPDYD